MITYTLDEIKHYWQLYIHTNGVRILREGKWYYNFNRPKLNQINGTRAEFINLQKVMTFPKYLEKYGKK